MLVITTLNGLTYYQIARQYGDADGRISRESFTRLRSAFPMIGEFEDLIDKPDSTFVTRENVNAYIKLVCCCYRHGNDCINQRYYGGILYFTPSFILIDR